MVDASQISKSITKSGVIAFPQNDIIYGTEIACLPHFTASHLVGIKNLGLTSPEFNPPQAEVVKFTQGSEFGMFGAIHKVRKLKVAKFHHLP